MFMQVLYKYRKVILAICIIIFLGSYGWSIKKDKEHYMAIYNNGIAQLEAGNYQESLQILTGLGDFKDSLKYVEEAKSWIRYEQAEIAYNRGEYEEAKRVFGELGENKDFDGATDAQAYVKRIDLILEGKNPQKEQYDEATQLFNSENYREALSIFKNLGDYEQSKEFLQKCEMAVKILQNSTTISAGTRFSTGIQKDGTVVACGYRPLKTEVETWSEIVSISAFGSLVIGLKIDGTVVTAGELNEKYRIETRNWEDIIAVSAGDLYIVGLRNNGTLVAQGYSGDGQMDIDDWTDIKAIDTGWRHTVGLTNSGEVKIAGLRHSDEELIKNDPRWHDIIAISAGGGYPGEPGEQGHTVGLRSDGKVLAVGDNGYGQCDFTNWRDKKIVAIAAGGFHTVGLTDDGKVVTTEDNDYVLNDIKKWEEEGYVMVAIAAGYGTTFAVDTEGNIHSTGYEFQNQRDTDAWGKILTHVNEWSAIRPDSTEISN